jgi:hypothetical protein
MNLTPGSFAPPIKNNRHWTLFEETDVPDGAGQNVQGGLVLGGDDYMKCYLLVVVYLYEYPISQFI